MKTLNDILNQCALSALFQPIMDFTSGEFIGFEGLIRGPVDSPLHSPVNLFCAAQQQGLSLEVEMLSRQIVLAAFANQALPGKLFLNVSPDTLSHPSFKNGQTLAYLENLGIDPERVIIEITENQPTFDFDAMRNALLHYRSMGFQIAIDDLGAGFSSLRLWSELRPEYVKIDMHFVQGIDTDPLKRQFLKSIQQIAQSSGTQIVAEGIETDAEFRVIHDIGIACGQGYFIARPSPIPPLIPPVCVGSLISASHAAVQSYYSTRDITVETILHHVESLQPETLNEQIFAHFTGNSSLRAIPIVKHGRPVGLISRNDWLESFSQPGHRELLGMSCSALMNPSPLLVEKSTPIHELSNFLSESEIQHFTSGFIITEKGRYLGIGTGQDLLREITRAQIENARYANPLTRLPGNVPINEHIDYLLHNGKSFTVCHADIDNLKPFNDAYGYRKGDDVIQFTGKLLANVCDPKDDFIGHIGGDDFVMILQSANWENRCNQALSAFAQTSATLFERRGHRSIGGYSSKGRQGNIVYHPLPTLSIGAIRVLPQQFGSHYEVAEAAADARKMAKEKPGNSLFIEQRGSQQPEMPNLCYG